VRKIKNVINHLSIIHCTEELCFCIQDLLGVRKIYMQILCSQKKKTVLNVNLWCTEYIDIMYM